MLVTLNLMIIPSEYATMSVVTFCNQSNRIHPYRIHPYSGIRISSQMRPLALVCYKTHQIGGEEKCAGTVGEPDVIVDKTSEVSMQILGQDAKSWRLRGGHVQFH